MMKDLPNRDGWMTGTLAALPPCGPFPAFTNFEKIALERIASLFGSAEAAFRKQVDAANVVDRINTVAGFYTRVIVDRAACSPVRYDRQGEHFEVEGVENGIGVIVSDADGYLSMIEGWTTDDDPLEGRDLAGLKVLPASIS